MLGLTGAGEARAELVRGVGWRPAAQASMTAVMQTVAHRVAADPRRFGATIQAACLAARQYSCWDLGGGANHDWVMAQAAAVQAGAATDPATRACISAAARIVDGILPDLVAGATHYYAPLSMVPPGRVPSWAGGRAPCAFVGQHLFFKGV